MLLIACGDERSHFERQETTLVVSAPATARLRLFHAGDDLEEARELDFPATRRKWLSKGRYFLQVDEGGQTLYYPVVVLGFRAGPDRDGTLAITVRPAPTSHLPDFADVPSGYVLLGDSANPQEQHYVWVSAYAMSVFEVTNAQFREFLFDPSGFAKPENWTKQGRDWIASNHSTASALMSPSAPDFGRFGQPEQPVTGVTWFEANAFCRWSYRASGGREVALHASQRRGVGKGRSRPGRFRLRPRNVDQRQADWLVQLAKKPWRSRHCGGPAGERPRVPVEPLWHLSHVRQCGQWTQSVFRAYSRRQPFADDDRNNDDSAERRTVRGGSWYSATTAAIYLAYRDGFQPYHRSDDVGFRVIARLTP